MPDAKNTRNKSTEMMDAFSNGFSVFENLFSATQAYWAGMSRYTTDFIIPSMVAGQYFNRVEGVRLLKGSPVDSFEAYLKLLQNNFELMERSAKGTADRMTAYAQMEIPGLTSALQQSCFELKHEKLAQYTRRQAELLDMVTHNYPKSIDAIEPEFGFHFERGEHELLDETDRFLLYRVTPSLAQGKTRADAKPVLIIPPFVLGAHILGFLPGEQRSYAHCYANQGFPTYIRVLKDIDSSLALQLMTAEDDAKDTRRFCEAILKVHGKPVTLNGYCQGGYTALCNLLSGQLDGLVDAFITCVSPIDGTRSKGLASFLSKLPPEFNDLAYGTKVLPNGNHVTDGKLMGWVYKFKSIKHEIPAAAFFRDLAMFARQKNGEYKISKTAAALNYWLQNERYDLPLEITRMSYASYTVPITKDGTLPVRLFGEKLNLKRLNEKKIPWLICYGTEDDLVEKETALAPLDFIDVEVTPFPKGHVAIATSWSSPDSACALHTRFGEGNYRGPVLFHMDLDAALNKAANEASQESKLKSTTPVQPKAQVEKRKQVEKLPVTRKKIPQNDPVENVAEDKRVRTDNKKPVQLTNAATAKTTPEKVNKPTAAVAKAAKQKVDKPNTVTTRPDRDSSEKKP